MMCWWRCCVETVVRQSSGDMLLVFSPRGTRQDLLMPSWAILRSASHDTLLSVPSSACLRTMLGASWNRRQVALRARPFMCGSRDYQGSSHSHPHAIMGACCDHFGSFGTPVSPGGGHRRWYDARLEPHWGHEVTRSSRALASTSP